MDELLRAYARKRGEQAQPALQLHPATRKLLQDEVKRTFGAKPAQTRRNWPAIPWPLAALGGSLAVLLLTFALFNTPSRKPSPGHSPMEQSLSEAKPALNGPASSVDRTASPAPLVSSAESKSSDLNLPVASAGAVAQSSVPLAPAVVPPAASGTPQSEGSLSEFKPVPGAPAMVAEKALSAAPAGSLTTPELAGVPPPVAATATVALSNAAMAPAAPPPLDSAARDARRGDRDGRVPRQIGSAVVSTAPAGVPPAATDDSEVVAGQFVQFHDRAQPSAAPSPPANVLSIFQMRRSGQNVSIVDADGSVYNGRVLGGFSGGAALSAGRFVGPQGAARLRKDIQQEANWAFKVAGTNSNLQQNVVFTGNVLAMPLAAPAANAAAQNRNASQLQNAQNSRITGKVQVGGGKEYEIQAKPPEP